MSTTQVDPALIAMFDRNMVEFYVQSRSRPWATIQCYDSGNSGLRMPEDIAKECLQAVKPLLESWKKG